MDAYDKVKRSFGPSAQAYATSATHADAEALSSLCDLAKASHDDVALDVATGAGNLALALAPRVKRVVASDLTPEMLAVTAQRAAELGLSNLETRLAAAEDLPFPDQSFSLVTCRVAPHHFADIRKAIHEMARVLSAGGRLAVVDTIVPEDPTLDREINAIELLRDPSHMRNLKASEWREYIEAEGLTVTHFELGTYAGGRPMAFASWVERIRTKEEAIVELRHRFQNAPPELREALGIVTEPELAFVLPMVTVVAIKP